MIGYRITNTLGFRLSLVIKFTWNKQTDRHKQAQAFLAKRPEVKTLVGHSLGGAVVLELKKDHPDLTGRIYGTPYYDPCGMDKIKDTFDAMRKQRDDYRKDKLFVEKAVNWVYDREQDLFEKNHRLGPTQRRRWSRKV